MGKAVLLAALLAFGCGRLAFDTAAVANSDDASGDDASGDDAPVPDCGGLAATCGPAGSSPCCGSPLVDGGAFNRQYDGLGYNDLSFPATVSTFRLDTYEVTVGRFRRFVEAGMGTRAAPPPAGSGAHANLANSGWDPSWNVELRIDTTALIARLHCNATFQTWTDAPAANENRPINCVNWYDAMAFCIWDGGYLPTATELNYAASGGNQHRAFPWSNPPSSLTNDDSTYASYWVDATKQCYGDMMNGCALSDLVPVGSKPAGSGLWGHADLGGNVREWALDYNTPLVNPCNDCANLTPGTFRVVHGGSYEVSASLMRSASPDYGDVRSPYGWVGIRCARTP